MRKLKNFILKTETTINKEVTEDTSVYSSLRAEIIMLEDQQTNLIIYMYVISASLIAFGLQSQKPTMYLILYIVIIPFQYIINKNTINILKISYYITEFFEKQSLSFNWESYQKFDPFNRYYGKISKSFFGILSKSGAILLGLLSTALYIIESSTQYISIQDGIHLQFNFDLLCVFISIILLILDIICTYPYIQGTLVDDSLKDITNQFYKYVHTNSNNKENNL